MGYQALYTNLQGVPNTCVGYASNSLNPAEMGNTTIGYNTQTEGNYNLSGAILNSVMADAVAMSIGPIAGLTSIAIGDNSKALTTYAISTGQLASAIAAFYGIAFGKGAAANAEEGIVIGSNSFNLPLQL